MVMEAAVERVRREKKRISTHSDQTARMRKGLPHPGISVYWIYKSRMKRLRRREPYNSIKKRVHFGIIDRG
jgi:hypothetical protein